MRRKWILAGFVFAAALLIAYLGSVARRSYSLYEYLKGRERGWSAAVHRADPQLGYAPRPDTRASHVFPVGPDVPMRFGCEGLRIPVDAPDELALKRPLILALGCSFTYGDACLAEETFPYRVAEALGGTALNAGVCGYGYAQMGLLAQRLIPRYRPDVVLFQASPWLWDRAVDPRAETYFGVTPVPYYARAENGFELRGPEFRSLAIGLPVAEYRDGPASPVEFLRFFASQGLRLFVHDDLHALPQLWRARPGPPERAEVLDALLTDVARTCAVQRSRLLVVQIGSRDGPDDDARVARLPGAVLVDATEALEDRLPERTRAAYLRAYGHWRGTPPRLVDTHFNADAHAVVAEEILATLADAGTDPPRQR